MITSEVLNRHSNFEEGFGGTPMRIKLTKIMIKWLPCTFSSKFKDSKNFTAHLCVAAYRLRNTGLLVLLLLLYQRILLRRRVYDGLFGIAHE